MKLFLTSCLVACYPLALPSLALTPDTPGGKSISSPGASLKIQSITTTTTTTIGPDGEKHHSTVTKMQCAGPAFDCAVNSAGEPVHVPPVVL